MPVSLLSRAILMLNITGDTVSVCYAAEWSWILVQKYNFFGYLKKAYFLVPVSLLCRAILRLNVTGDTVSVCRAAE